MRLACCFLAGIGVGLALGALAHNPHSPPFWLSLGFWIAGAAGYLFFTARLTAGSALRDDDDGATTPEVALVLLCIVSLGALVNLFVSLLFVSPVLGSTKIWGVAASIVTMGIAFVAASWVWLRRSKPPPSRRLDADDDEGGAEIIVVAFVGVLMAVAAFLAIWRPWRDDTLWWALAHDDWQGAVFSGLAMLIAIPSALVSVWRLLGILKRRRRRRDDEGGAEILAILIVVGMAVLLVAVATGPLRACQACESSAAPSTPGARWTNCELAHSDATPNCADLQPGEVLVTRDGAPVCVLRMVTTASASAGSSIVRNVEVRACEAVTIASGG